MMPTSINLDNIENMTKRLTRLSVAPSLVYATAVRPPVRCYVTHSATISFGRATVIPLEEPKEKVLLCPHGPFK